MASEKRDDRFKLNILLDLDQTCISGEDLSTFNVNQFKQKSLHFKSYNMDNVYEIYERPHLQKFLDYIFSHFNVSIWTAASADYGMFIIQNIICPPNKNRQLDYFLHSKHCTESKRKLTATKNLDMLYDVWKLPGYYPNNTIIIDDLKEVYETQPINCINIKPFEFTKKNSEKDTELNKITTQLVLFDTK